MEEYFNITLTRNEGQRLAYVSICLERKAFEWWRANKPKFRTWEEAQAGFRSYYGDRYKKDRSHQELLALVQTGPIQDYLTEVDRLNGDAGIPDDKLISMILPLLSQHLRSSMAHYENLRATPVQWRQTLVEMDFSIREVQAITRPTGSSYHQPEQQNGKRSAPHQPAEKPTNLQGGNPPSSSTGNFISRPTKDKRKADGRCIKCGRTGHSIKDCRSEWIKTPPPPNSNKDEPSSKKQRTDKGHLRITELGSDNDDQSGNE